MSKERSGLEFSKEIRRQVREDQEGHCDVCDHKMGRFLPIHHIIPKSFVHELRGFVDSCTYTQFRVFIHSKDNAIGLCNICHPLADSLAINNHIYHGWNGSLGIPFEPKKPRGRERL